MTETLWARWKTGSFIVVTGIALISSAKVPSICNCLSQTSTLSQVYLYSSLDVRQVLRFVNREVPAVHTWAIADQLVRTCWLTPSSYLLFFSFKSCQLRENWSSVLWPCWPHLSVQPAQGTMPVLADPSYCDLSGHWLHVLEGQPPWRRCPGGIGQPIGKPFMYLRTMPL